VLYRPDGLHVTQPSASEDSRQINKGKEFHYFTQVKGECQRKSKMHVNCSMLVAQTWHNCSGG